MKKLLLIVLCLQFIFIIKSHAQNNSVEAARVAFISQKIALTPVQAEKFWPVFNELNNQRADLKRTIRKIYEKMELPTEQTNEKIKAYIDQLAQLKQKEATLEKDYYNRFLLIITAKQLADLFSAEREFQKILLKKVAAD